MQSPEYQAVAGFRSALMRVAESQPSSVDQVELGRCFDEAVLKFGSESDDNRKCLEQIDIGEIIEPHQEPQFGLRLKGTTAPLSGVLWRAEGCGIPAELSESLPWLTQQQWDAVMRLATLVMLAHESGPADSEE